MLVVELAFTSAPERLAARPAHREALARLHAAGELVVAGPWGDESGALLVFAVDRPRLEEVMRDDPYYRRTPGVEVRSIREWAPILGFPRP
ncbi:YciI family protein [Streptomyces resistomycificus]|uniref:YCII-related domain-containing protein n=1 Tax=Streptomyces resistomycificus TaxID=67356 RepID=A0A0L8L0Y7_9ACTN|nr:YciI family protein [Streptomyces resistomycificus]KOG31842.1 hypothetical protein ADK37_29670 [Streptomyces resistomycificus]KUN90492.1 hypothetical protein AQJ84_39885 [Streptomyces resistomycificus]